MRPRSPTLAEGLTYRLDQAVPTKGLVTIRGASVAKQPKRFTNLLDMELRYPKKADRLFHSADEFSHGLSFSQDVIARHVFMGEGYIRAADALIDVCEQNSHEKNYLIYPILFNYRQAVELEMKWVIKVYGHYADVNKTDIKHHDLWQLWKLCKQIIIELGSEDDMIYYVETIIKEFHDLDRSGLAFRYPDNINGILISLPDQEIDLTNMLIKFSIIVFF